ncbi:MAG TPA: energy transducer TonB [Pyrinomonadaceae bacterium]|nr:energy transducer TonB [Pyrinomonadaceae bacterium]
MKTSKTETARAGRGGAVDLPINAVAVMNADKTPTMSLRDQFVKVLRFEVDGKLVRKTFRVSLYDNDKFVNLKTVKDGFILPAKFTRHEFVRIRFRIGRYDLFFDPVYRAKFDTDWIVGVDTKPFDPDIVYGETAKHADVVHYIEFEPRSGDGTILLIPQRDVPPKTPNSRSGEVVGSKIFVDETVAKLPDEAIVGEVLSADAVVTNIARPAYPAIAAAKRVSGVVLVDVQLSSNGTVKQASPISGHSVLRRAAEQAALRWRFNSVEDDNNLRSVRLTFIFRPVSYVPKEGEPEFTRPYQMAVTWIGVAASQR